MDPLPDFLADRCDVNDKAFVQVSPLWKAYKEWADENGDREFLKRSEFNRRLERAEFKRGQRRIDRKPKRGWIGLSLKDEQR